MDAVLADWRTAPIDDRLRAALGFLEVVTLQPSTVSADSIRPLRAARLSDRAIREAVYVCFLFNTLDRLADALNFALPSNESARKIGDIAFRFGYSIAKLPG